jgi:hypothetical protein
MLALHEQQDTLTTKTPSPRFFPTYFHFQGLV